MKLTTVEIVQIRQFYQEGYALARIRQKVGVKISLYQLLTVATSRKYRR